MSDQSEIVLSAYLDGEPVDAGTVLAALDTEEGRRALVDFVRLRLGVADEASASPEFYVRMRGVVPALPARSPRTMAWPVAAALAASLLIGLWTGSTLTSRRDSGSSIVTPAGPPRAVRVMEFQPGVDWQQIPSGEPHP